MKKLFIAFLFLPALCFGNRSLDLTAKGALEWNPISKQVIAIKDAKVVYQETTILADRITGYYTEKNGEKDFLRVVAKGDVRIQNKTQHVETEELSYDLSTGIMKLTGKPWTRLFQKETILSSKLPIIYNDKEGLATATHAEIKHENRILKAPKLTAYFSKSSKGLEKVIASGNISLKTEEETLTSKEAIYDAKSGLATLTQNVSLTRKDGSTLKGGKLVYDMKKGITRLHANPKTGKVEGVFK